MKKKNTQGFTLIELLVVITIIAILASIAVPVYSNITVRAHVAKATSNAKQIVLAEKLYAMDEDGLFSPDIGTLMTEGYVDSENIFKVTGGSSFIDPAIDEATATGDGTLAAGENHWSYFSGASDATQSNSPIVTDGGWETSTFSAGSFNGGKHPWVNARKLIFGLHDGSVITVKLTKPADATTAPSLSTGEVDYWAIATAQGLTGISASSPGGSAP